MRTIDDHKINPANDKLIITVLDPPSHGGASHVYAISGMELMRNEAVQKAADDYPEDSAVIMFQCGGIAEHGVNGVTQEALLAIVADRLRSFQAGPFSSRENALALTKIEEAQHWLQQRTLRRMRQGIEGTHQPDPKS